MCGTVGVLLALCFVKCFKLYQRDNKLDDVVAILELKVSVVLVVAFGFYGGGIWIL